MKESLKCSEAPKPHDNIPSKWGTSGILLRAQEKFMLLSVLYPIRLPFFALHAGCITLAWRYVKYSPLRIIGILTWCLQSATLHDLVSHVLWRQLSIYPDSIDLSNGVCCQIPRPCVDCPFASLPPTLLAWLILYARSPISKKEAARVGTTIPAMFLRPDQKRI